MMDKYVKVVGESYDDVLELLKLAIKDVKKYNKRVGKKSNVINVTYEYNYNKNSVQLITKV